jgi:hypothetical protein
MFRTTKLRQVSVPGIVFCRIIGIGTFHAVIRILHVSENIASLLTKSHTNGGGIFRGICVVIRSCHGMFLQFWARYFKTIYIFDHTV